jgi:hypothetical protein
VSRSSSRNDRRSEYKAAAWIGALALIFAFLLALVPEAIEARLRAKREARTRIDLRLAATAIESLFVEENRYPRQDQLGPMRGDMARLLEGTYRGSLPVRDAWGRPFHYWSNEEEFLLLSLGSDGRPAGQLRTYGESVHDRPVGDDIYYRQTGSNSSWPEGTGVE